MIAWADAGFCPPEPVAGGSGPLEFHMIRAVFSLVAFIALTVLGAVVSILIGPFTRSGDAVLAVARVWSRVIIRIAGVRIRARFAVPLDPKRPYIFASNHLSSLDIWALFVVTPVGFRFIAKKQLGQIPLFGWAMKAGRFIFIDRQNAVAARRSIEEAARRISQGVSVLIFPEGTRSRDGRLLPFKKGGFHLAIDSGVEIVPVAIRGTAELMPASSLLLRAGEAFVEFGAPIPTTGLTAADRTPLLKQVHARVAEMLGQPVDEASKAADSGTC